MSIVNPFLERCAMALDVLSHRKGGMALGDLAAAMGIPKSATHRILSSLCGIGWVSQDEETGSYSPTLKLALLGQRMIGAKLPEICQPMLDRLAEETKELVRLAVVDNGSLVWIAAAQGALSGIIYQPAPIERVPLHASANGKVWLASMDNEAAISLVLQEGFGKKGQFGPNAVTTIEGFLRELDATRENKFGLAWEETEAGIAAIAVAVRHPRAGVVGTMSVAGPIFRITRERIPQLTEQLQKTADELAQLWTDIH